MFKPRTNTPFKMLRAKIFILITQNNNNIKQILMREIPVTTLVAW